MAITPGIFSTDKTGRTEAFAQKQAKDTAKEDSQRKLNNALGTLNAGGTVPINKTTRVIKADGKLLVYNPQVVPNTSIFRGGNAELEKRNVAAAIAAGKASPISKDDLSTLLNPTKPGTPSAKPKPKSDAKPKKKLKGTADDDNKKEEKPAVKVRKTPDPELSPGKRLKNPLGALSSYNYQLTLYMVTPDALQIFKENGFKDINKLGVASAQGLGPDVGNSNAGAFVVAQSGGVNTSINPETGAPYESRAPSFVFDYGIDNLQFEIVAPKETGSPTAAYEFSFTIIEPYGFSFISNLRRARDAVDDYIKRLAKKKKDIAKKKAAAKNNRDKKNADKANPNRQAASPETTSDQQAKEEASKDATKGQGASTGTSQNPSRQVFILGIRFYGYDASGRPVRGIDTTAATDILGRVRGEQQIDPGNSSFALFERYYPIQIDTMTTVLDGRETRYTIKAQSLAMKAMGASRGIINNPMTLNKATVGEALDQMMGILNKEQEKLVSEESNRYSYDIKYASAEDADRIRSASIVSKADLDKYKWPGSGAKKTKESNASTETKKNSKPKDNAREIKIAKGTPILQAINEVIARSSFLEDALKTVYTTAIEPDSEKDSLVALDKSGRKTIEWFYCTPDVSNLKWNDSTADWVYDIDYILNVYDTPVIDTAYTNPGKKYYGAHKRYDYWYSGQNTEVLSYKQTLDNLYSGTFLDKDFAFGKEDKKSDKNGGKNTSEAGNGSGNAAGSTTPQVQNQRTGQPRQGKDGVGMEAQNSYLTSLFDPNAQAEAEVTILGDPDWLMSDSNAVFNNDGAKTGTLGPNETTVYSKFYGKDGYSATPSGGQVFFEIDFKEAIDYKSGGTDMRLNNGQGITGAPGTMSLNNSILFWKAPNSTSSLVKGLSYSLTSCTNIFSGGVFKQVLKGNINSFGDAGSNDDGKARENKSSNQKSNSGPVKGNAATTTEKTGLKPTPYSDAGKQAAGRLSPDVTTRTEAYGRKQAASTAVSQQLNAGIPAGIRARNTPET